MQIFYFLCKVLRKLTKPKAPGGSSKERLQGCVAIYHWKPNQSWTALACINQKREAARLFNYKSFDFLGYNYYVYTSNSIFVTDFIISGFWSNPPW